MPFDPINVGTSENDGTGDSLRAGGLKINANLNELFNRVAALDGGAGGTPTIDTTLAQVSDLNGVVVVRQTEFFTRVSDLNAVVIVRSTT